MLIYEPLLLHTELPDPPRRGFEEGYTINTLNTLVP